MGSSDLLCARSGRPVSLIFHSWLVGNPPGPNAPPHPASLLHVCSSSLFGFGATLCLSLHQNRSHPDFPSPPPPSLPSITTVLFCCCSFACSLPFFFFGSFLLQENTAELLVNDLNLFFFPFFSFVIFLYSFLYPFFSAIPLPFLPLWLRPSFSDTWAPPDHPNNTRLSRLHPPPEKVI